VSELIIWDWFGDKDTHGLSESRIWRKALISVCTLIVFLRFLNWWHFKPRNFSQRTSTGAMEILDVPDDKHRQKLELSNEHIKMSD
jgi:hypothetical protein